MLYLGHVLSAQGVQVDPTKVESLLSFLGEAQRCVRASQFLGPGRPVVLWRALPDRLRFSRRKSGPFLGLTIARAAFSY